MYWLLHPCMRGIYPIYKHRARGRGACKSDISRAGCNNEFNSLYHVVDACVWVNIIMSLCSAGDCGMTMCVCIVTHPKPLADVRYTIHGAHACK